MTSKQPLPFARKVNELVVYQKQRALARQIFEITKRFTKEERYALTDQVRRSSRSVGAQIAEAWAKREYKNHFYSKLTDADAEQEETRRWIETANDCHYLERGELAELLGLCDEIGRMLEAMKERAACFCRDRESHTSMLLEEPDEDLSYFFIEPTDV
jgi:four helix bundle protein